MISTYASKTLPNTANSDNSRISNQIDKHCIKRTLHFLRIPFIVIILITLFECSIGNLPFWSSVTGSTDSISAHNDIGSGIRRLASGGILITDPSEAYLEVTSDGSSPYIRLEPAIIKKKSKNNNLISNINVLVEANKYLSKPQSTNTASLNPSLLKLPKQAVGKSCIVRVWLQHPIGSILNIEDSRANVRVPFRWSWGRVLILAIFAFLVTLWNPWSKLWKINLNTHSLIQRCCFAASLLPFIAVGLITIFWNLRNATPMHFYTNGNYAYDFDQYAHTADALLKGQVHLNLPVPNELEHLQNPYDPTARNNLLNHSVQHMYWDYAYYKGHWYSYFGVLPAILLFLPYRIISRLWTPEGSMLPTTVATIIFLIGFLIAGSLLVIRIIEQTSKKVSLGTTSIVLALFFITSNTVYLWFRTSFYSVPMAASLFFTSLGLWCYLGFNKTHSLLNIVLGSFFIALNLGCRPTFSIAVLFALPAIYSHIEKDLPNILRNWKQVSSWHKPFKYFAAWILPCVITAIPFGIYNLLRFGSPLNFGNEYQITITDMTTMRLPSQNILPSIFSYIALPLRFIPTFPWIGIQPIAFDRWQYAEPMIGGMFTLSPLALVGIICVFIMKKRCRTHIAWQTSVIAIIVGLVLIVFDSLKAGIGWRYIADFAWSFAIAAAIGISLILEYASTLQSENSLHKKTIAYTIRLLVAVLLFASIAIAVLSWFVTGREDSTLRFNPNLWFAFRSWMTLF